MVEILFHGSPNGEIEVLEPRKGATPTVEQGRSPARVYAGDNAAYVAGHGFSWSTAEGVSLGFVQDSQGRELVKLSVPKAIAPRLEQPVFVYKLPADSFEPLPHVEPAGHNFASSVPVKTLSSESFPSVRAAVEFYGGIVEIRDEELGP